ncbi:hypothetical protein V6N13_118939 [Hibiscus sabdariffa]
MLGQNATKIRYTVSDLQALPASDSNQIILKESSPRFPSNEIHIGSDMGPAEPNRRATKRVKEAPVAIKREQKSTKPPEAQEKRERFGEGLVFVHGLLFLRNRALCPLLKDEIVLTIRLLILMGPSGRKAWGGDWWRFG